MSPTDRIDYTRRDRPGPTVVRSVEFHLTWDQVGPGSLWGEIRRTFLSAHDGVDRQRLTVQSVIFTPGVDEPETVGARATPSRDGLVQHTVVHSTFRDSFADNVFSGMPGGAEFVGVATHALPTGTRIVVVATASGGFDLAQLGPIRCRLTDPATARDLDTITFPQVETPHQCRIIACLRADGAGTWGLTPIGTTAVGRTQLEFVAATRRYS